MKENFVCNFKSFYKIFIVTCISQNNTLELKPVTQNQCPLIALCSGFLTKNNIKYF